LLNNIYVCDINADALETYQFGLSEFAHLNFGIYLDDAYFAEHIGSGLLFDLDSETPIYKSINSVFGLGFENNFDIVVTNPPYKNLRTRLVS